MRRPPRLFALAAGAVLALAGPTAAQGPPKEGAMVPDVRLKATQIKSVLPDAKDDTLSPADFKGRKKVVLFYFPKAMTKG
jgi:hypothetical protein